MTYRKKIALFFIGYSLTLSVIYSSLIVGSLFMIEDRLYERFLSQYLSAIDSPVSQAVVGESTQSRAEQTLAQTLPEKPIITKQVAGQPDKTDIPVISRQIYTQQNMPEYLKNLGSGITELDEMHILVQQLDNGDTMVLSLPEFGDLIDQIIPFALTLLFIIGVIISVLGALLAIILARQLSRPIENLVTDVKQASLDTSNICRDGSSTELNLLAQSFNETMLRISMTLEREKSFTQSVSHELRTPLMVMETNLAILRQHKDPLRVLQRTTARMQRAAESMNNLTDTFLILARHDKFALATSSFDPATVIKEVAQHAAQNGDVNNTSWVIECQQGTQVTAPEKLFEILINNIIDNGNKYAEDIATIIVTDDYLESYNNIAPHADSSHSSQLGLKIIERICHALDWQMVQTVSTQKFCLRITFKA